MTTNNNQKVVIVDYGMGNVASVRKAFEKLGARAVVSHDTKELHSATHIVLPGVGAFGNGIKNLKQMGLIEPLKHQVLIDKIPFLGICLGMQLLAESGEEFGTNEGLGWVQGTVVKLQTGALRLPHIGWNDITVTHNDIIFTNIPDNNFYFVHSYCLQPCDPAIISSQCTYGEAFVASIHKDNIFATQFHPEKSQLAGLEVLKNFLQLSHNA